MLYAVTVKPLNSVFFLSERPTEGPWKVQDGVELDIPSIYADWPEGSPRPEVILCTSISNPTSYRLFKYSRDIDPGEYRRTGRNFGGVFSPSSWDRFHKSLVAAQPFLEIRDDETPTPADAALGALKHEG